MNDTTRTHAVKTVLLNKYRQDKGYLAFDEVSSYHLPGQKDRICDMLVQSLWGSMGYTRIGIEIKVSKQDLRKELSDFSKSDVWYKYVNKWFLAVPSLDIITDEDIPDTWGVMLCTKNARIIKDASMHEAETPVELFTTWSNRMLKSYMSISEHIAQVDEYKGGVENKIAEGIERELERRESLRRDAAYAKKVAIIESIFGNIEWEDSDSLRAQAERLKYLWDTDWGSLDQELGKIKASALSVIDHVQTMNIAGNQASKL